MGWGVVYNIDLQDGCGNLWMMMMPMTEEVYSDMSSYSGSRGAGALSAISNPGQMSGNPRDGK